MTWLQQSPREVTVSPEREQEVRDAAAILAMDLQETLQGWVSRYFWKGPKLTTEETYVAKMNALAWIRARGFEEHSPFQDLTPR